LGRKPRPSFCDLHLESIGPESGRGEIWPSGWFFRLVQTVFFFATGIRSKEYLMSYGRERDENRLSLPGLRRCPHGYKRAKVLSH